jgi:hypothetical protein
MRQILIEKYIEPSERIIDGNCISELWFDEYGDRHSSMNHPAVIYYNNGKITKQFWYKKGELHRDGVLPAFIEYYIGKVLVGFVSLVTDNLFCLPSQSH